MALIDIKQAQLSLTSVHIF